MKKLIAAILLLLVSNIYYLFRITKKVIYLPEISMEVKNPVTLHWFSVQINTNIIESSDKAIYNISLVPFYIVIIICFILVLTYKKRKVIS